MIFKILYCIDLQAKIIINCVTEEYNFSNCYVIDNTNAENMNYFCYFYVRYIQHNELMSKKVTIYDIAKALNTTAATVSRALNNNPKISEKTRQLVLETAERMNYKQNKLALALKSGKSKNVGVIVPKINRSFFSTVIKGIEDELYPFGYHVIMCQTYDQKDREVDNINTLLNAQVDGIFMSISNAMMEDSVIQRVIDKNVPLIFFDRKRDMPGVSSVTIDDYKGGYQATEHLIRQGCKEIVHLSGDRALQIYMNRLKGYKQALKDYGIPFDDKLVLDCVSTLESGENAVRRLLKGKISFDAIFSSSDFVAVGSIKELKAKGYRIPDDVCVIGFSNEPFTKFMELSISSVDQSPLEMGKNVARVFLEQVLDSNNLKIEKKVVLSPELKIRMSSTRKVKKII